MHSNGAVMLLLLSLIALSSAWSWPSAPQQLGNLILERDDASSSDAQAASSTAVAAASSGAKASATAEATSTAASSDAAATTAAETTGASGTKTTKTSKTTSASIASTDSPGGVEMLEPATTAASTYYKIGDYVTFKWNYTSLSVTPTGIDIMASCSANDQLYTIALNQSVDATGAVTWDTGGYQSTATIPLLTETYTLVIYDAAQDVSATASAGHLDAAETFAFGMYIPQAYTPLNV
ncbi:hypothetical protein UCRPC4_g02411 [Phaeomoniella chlamydospora]|uniref:DUF7137 domain-containing protein n=1 Tax=Phaeomoniella chlamydospora TaxID=158046 RepID=A0A0G2GLY0_PHACM|nr:hypothetical protein UCRPC4_g02411 [Phaeomoniella chlamydospora]